MRIAIFGATSQIAKDLILSISNLEGLELLLFSRKPEAISQWLLLNKLGKRFQNFNIADFSDDIACDVIINFIGVGNPSHVIALGASILEITAKYDELALNYLKKFPAVRYLFLSSGAVFGQVFEKPVDVNTKPVINAFGLVNQDYYSLAKRYAEHRHRALENLAIVDIRIFNYVSHNQDIEASFLISDIFRAILTKSTLQISSEPTVRDFLHPDDFCSLVLSILKAPPVNIAIDAYTKLPITKNELVDLMHKTFGMKYEFIGPVASKRPVSQKTFYYSLSRVAEKFGYQPRLSSAQGILIETKKFLDYKGDGDISMGALI